MEADQGLPAQAAVLRSNPVMTRSSGKGQGCLWGSWYKTGSALAAGAATGTGKHPVHRPPLPQEDADREDHARVHQEAAGRGGGPQAGGPGVPGQADEHGGAPAGQPQGQEAHGRLLRARLQAQQEHDPGEPHPLHAAGKHTALSPSV